MLTVECLVSFSSSIICHVIPPPLYFFYFTESLSSQQGHKIPGTSSSSLQRWRWPVRSQQKLLWQKRQHNLHLCEFMDQREHTYFKSYFKSLHVYFSSISTFHVALPLMFFSLVGTSWHCGEGAWKDNSRSFSAWPGVHGCVWRVRWKG